MSTSDGDDDEGIFDCGVDADEIIKAPAKLTVKTLEAVNETGKKATKIGGQVVVKTAETTRDVVNTITDGLNQTTKSLLNMYPTPPEDTTTNLIQDHRKYRRMVVVRHSGLPTIHVKKSSKMDGCYENDIYAHYNGRYEVLRNEQGLTQTFGFQKSKMDYLENVTGLSQSKHKGLIEKYVDDVMIGLVAFKVLGTSNTSIFPLGVDSPQLSKELLFNDTYCSVLLPSSPVTNKTAQDCNLSVIHNDKTYIDRMKLLKEWNKELAMSKKDEITNTSTQGSTAKKMIVRQQHHAYQFLKNGELLGLNFDKFKRDGSYEFSEEGFRGVIDSIQEKADQLPMASYLSFTLHTFGQETLVDAIQNKMGEEFLQDEPGSSTLDRIFRTYGFEACMHARVTYNLYVSEKVIAAMKKEAKGSK